MLLALVIHHAWVWPRVGNSRGSTVNGELQVPTTQVAKDQRKNGGWQNFTSPAFKNQGDCVSYFATGGGNRGNG